MKTSVFLKRDRELTRGRQKKKKNKWRFPYVGRAKWEAEVILTLIYSKSRWLLLHQYYYGKEGNIRWHVTHTQSIQDKTSTEENTWAQM